MFIPNMIYYMQQKEATLVINNKVRENPHEDPQLLSLLLFLNPFIFTTLLLFPYGGFNTSFFFLNQLNS